MAALVDYDSGSGSDNDVSTQAEEEENLHLKESVKPIHDMKKALMIKSNPDVVTKFEHDKKYIIDPVTKQLSYNPKYEELFTPVVGPENPFKTRQQKANKNMLSGFVEEAHVSDFQFDNQRKTFHSYGYALDPSEENIISEKIIGDQDKATATKGITVFEDTKPRPGDKRVREEAGDPSDIEAYKGPWAKFVDEETTAKPSEEQQAILEQYESAKQKKGKQEEERIEEKSKLHIQDAYDYQGRSFLHIPQDLGVDLVAEDPPDKCFLPKKRIHTWTGHSKGVSAIRLFPKSGHLLLSCSMDSKIKIWEVYNKRRCIRTYHGDCLGKFSNNKVPYCVKFNPDEDKQHLFIAGMADKKMITWDTRENEIVQEYDRHLGAVNTITFVDQNKRLVTTSDDKSIRIWEWDIPVDTKYIADPGMHSMPSTTLSPNQKWLACQSMDNQIVIYSVLNKFRQNKKKIFKGHMNAGYACQVNFSPDMSYLISGDADGKLNIWDWKSTKLYCKFKAHDEVCIGCEWLPHETSKIVTCGWDGLIKLWD
eukprot:gene479-1124_t